LLALALAQNLADALLFAFGMFCWEIPWALILGFALSDAVQAVVSKQEMRRLLPDDSPRWLARATVLGAASSSCSYAAVALARSLFRKGADFTAAMAFQFASPAWVPSSWWQSLFLEHHSTLAKFWGPLKTPRAAVRGLRTFVGRNPELRARLATTGNEPADSAAHSPRPA